MSSTKKAALVAVTIAVLVVAFVALRPTVDEDGSTATTPTTAESAPAPETEIAPQETTAAEAEPEPELERVSVREGAPLHGVQDVTVTRGEQVRLEFFSADTSDEIHIHGYDRYVDLEAGEPVRDSFEADAEGIFEIELHGSATQIASLTVEPR